MEIMEQYDSNKDMILTLNEFRRYFYDRAVKDMTKMWHFLNLNGYFNNLRKSNEQPKELSVESLPRYLLCDDHVFETFFNILKNPQLEPIHIKLYNLITSLPTNKRIESAVDTDFKVLDTCFNIY